MTLVVMSFEISYNLFLSSVSVSFSAAYRRILGFLSIVGFLVTDIFSLNQLTLRIQLSSWEAERRKLFHNLWKSCIIFSSCSFILVISLLILAVNLYILSILCSNLYALQAIFVLISKRLHSSAYCRCNSFVSLVSGSLSLGHGASPGCGWINGLQYGG
jgi:hypothetical protein